MVLGSQEPPDYQRLRRTAGARSRARTTHHPVRPSRGPHHLGRRGRPDDPGGVRHRIIRHVHGLDDRYLDHPEVADHQAVAALPDLWPTIFHPEYTENDLTRGGASSETNGVKLASAFPSQNDPRRSGVPDAGELHTFHDSVRQSTSGRFADGNGQKCSGNALPTPPTDPDDQSHPDQAQGHPAGLHHLPGRNSGLLAVHLPPDVASGVARPVRSLVPGGSGLPVPESDSAPVSSEASSLTSFRPGATCRDGLLRPPSPDPVRAALSPLPLGGAGAEPLASPLPPAAPVANGPGAAFPGHSESATSSHSTARQSPCEEVPHVALTGYTPEHRTSREVGCKPDISGSPRLPTDESLSVHTDAALGAMLDLVRQERDAGERRSKLLEALRKWGPPAVIFLSAAAAAASAVVHNFRADDRPGPAMATDGGAR